MRIAVLEKDRCKPKDCNFLCMRICPRVKMGDETITVNKEENKPVISEGLCSGCGICIKKCPYEAIHIINLPEEIGEPVHQYGKNGFRIYNLPTPKPGVVGIVGCNGIGKTTALSILSGSIKPNLGENADWSEIIERFRGNEIQNYLEKLSQGNVKAVYKPQHVDRIAKHVKGTVKALLEKGDETGELKNVVKNLDLENALDKDINALSGGELQRVAIAAALTKNADIYLLDEPSSYLDVKERLNVARAVRSLKDKYIMVVEHDLVVLDYLSDYVHVIFGVRGAYGIVSNIKSVRVGINEYLAGFLKSENMRFRDEIKFDVRSPKETKKRKKLVEYPALEKTLGNFKLKTINGVIYLEQTLGILGPNATGKTTFVKMLAGVLKPDDTELELGVRVSYKPQYIPTSNATVKSLGLKNNLAEHFGIIHLADSKINTLSGGELQRVAISDCLSKDADIYLLDEPSAYLDVEERLSLGKFLRRFAVENKKSVLVVDHDLLLVDYLSDGLMVFSGVSGVNGTASGSLSLKEGMNKFLREMGVTFRRDPDSGRPRANKPDSVKDREQKDSGDYYYVG